MIIVVFRHCLSARYRLSVSVKDTGAVAAQIAAYISLTGQWAFSPNLSRLASDRSCTR